MKYRMKYISGGGTEYDGGIWDVVETAKITTFTCTQKPFFEPACPYVLRCKKDNTGAHKMNYWGDGFYTVYPNRSGTPHIFEPEPLLI